MSDHILSITEIARSVQQTLEGNYGSIAVRGEISNYVHHSSGHRYFSLKDSGAQIKAVMWRSSPVRFTPTNGMSVIARGKITMYAPQGSLQIECRTLEAEGEGDLQMAFEALKRMLFERGWFDAARKKPLPRFPMTIGVATSPTGAAVRDILTTLNRRMPSAHVIFRPCAVQGESAAEDIAGAIADLNSTDCDVLIVGRGGGSIEDLWAFNTETVADAIIGSRLPIISAVGHEIDVTIADYVADVRAATPTAAAELAVRDTAELLAALRGTREYMDRTVRQNVQMLAQRVSFLTASGAMKRFPGDIQRAQQYADDLQMRMVSALPRVLATKAQRLQGLQQHLASLHPFAPLDKGFALLQRNGRMVEASEALREGEHIEILRGKNVGTQERVRVRVEQVERVRIGTTVAVESGATLSNEQFIS
jgi:exodeoxyribonuclease VII large subunit